MTKQKMEMFEPRKVDRSPTLDTIIMIETALYKHRSEKTTTQIWKLLPKKVMWTTFTTVLKYLEYSGKIHVESDKTVSWLWNPKLVAKLKKNNLVVR
jgi:hypothetical protein